MAKYQHQEINAYLIWSPKQEFACVTNQVKKLMNHWNEKGQWENPYTWDNEMDRWFATDRLAEECGANAFIITDDITELVKTCREAKRGYKAHIKEYLKLVNRRLGPSR